jgi:ubiquitin-conjugating enzyme E2 J1
MSNISLKRIQKEFQNMINDPSEDFYANPIKDDMFCWHFTIRGPPDTEFEGGLYHGIIKLPMSYPNRPPSIMFLTPNGRFDVNMDVCLSMTQYHKEEWQAAWTIRSMLEAIIAFFPVKEEHNAIGALDSSVESRKHFAKLSVKYKCDVCGPIANLLKPIEKTENNDKKNNTRKNSNSNNLENKNNKNIKSNNIHNNIKKDGDSSSNSSLASNQTGKFKFKRDKANSIDNYKQVINNININNKIEEKENIIDNNQDEKDITTNINDKEQNNNILNNANKDLENNTLLKSIYDELEFINIRKSIQYHDNQTNDEIETNLTKQKINKSKQRNENNLFTLNNLLEDEINEDDKDENNNINKYIKNNLLNEKEFCVQKLEENIKYIKFFSRKNYEEIRDKNKRKLMYVMIGIMIVIFIFYLIGIKYSDSINRLIKVLMTPRE